MTSDLAADLLRHGYEALPSARARRGHGDTFRARLLGRRTLVVRGEEGARLLYDETRIRRQRAVPTPLADLLFGKGAVHGLDGEAHRARKRIFLELLSEEAVGDLAVLVDDGLSQALEDWSLTPGVRLHDALVRVYGTAVLAWGGTGCTGREAEQVSRDLADVVAGFGFRGAAYARAWAARRRVDAWARDLVGRTRDGELRPAPGTALHAFALGGGAGLPVAVAAVDLLNVLRPTVAVSWLGTFAALALAEHPDEASRLVGSGSECHLRAFADEVRRTTPFVPALAGVATTDFRAHLHEVRAGDRILLDVPGTNRDSRQWSWANDFRPARFLEQPPGEYAFVPQGGGPREGHRCPGEGVTTALLVVTLRRLARTGFRLTAGPVPTRHIPTLPTDLTISDVEPADDGSRPFVPVR
jgi:fatty-acid peroxygenase